jgi:uncharacterized protein (DUF1800 family)
MRKTDIAWSRFGLGPRPGDEPLTDPIGWLRDQMDDYRPDLASTGALASRARIIADFHALRTARKQAMQAASMAGDAKVKVAQLPQSRQFRGHYEAQAAVRIRAAVASETPFVERLVHFWSNHFEVSIDKPLVLGLAGLMEFEAIRPHVLGRFEDMLLAVVQHPAMLLYLDQVQSIGPKSQFGQKIAARGRNQGLNENLGREILELHTLGARSGYSQSDVTELARALTGWTAVGLGNGPVQRLTTRLGGGPGDFLFAPPLHEPGRRTILDRTYPQAGMQQVRAILTDLARHPATARHLATKIARHFIADEPPAPLVARLETVYLEKGGDLRAVYAALITAPEAWANTESKFRTPWDWLIGAFRLQGGVPEMPDNPDQADHQLAGLFAQLGQPIWQPGSPAGFADSAGDWAGPEALFRRVEVAQRLARHTSPATDPREVAGRVFGEALRPATAQVVARAESPQQGMALLLVAPEMMRR